MEGEEVSRTLPEDLVEKIVAMMPFPQILKGRLLSKSWFTRLSLVLSQDDEDKKSVAASFQERLREYSKKWENFSPTFVSNKNLIAYNWTSKHWQIVSTLSFLPRSEYSDIKILDMKGALMLFKVQPREHRYLGKDLYVANIATRSWKRLPPAPNMDGYPGKLAREGDTYKVIVITLLLEAGMGKYDSCLFGQIYDPKLGTWSTKRIDIPGHVALGLYRGDSGAESVDGVRYWVFYHTGKDIKFHMPVGLIAFNVKEETFKVIKTPDIDLEPFRDPYTDFFELVLCNGSLILASHSSCDYVNLAKLDLVSQTWLEITEKSTASSYCKGATSDGQYIFFVDYPFSGVEAYDVQEDKWISTFDATLEPSEDRGVSDQYQPICSGICFSFQPGWNPFMAL